ncbi:DsbA family protein [Variovorax sp. J22R187]|nr:MULTISPECIES: DsbA family protein [unclassified Variovorax]MDM0022314.1 DsbA family protein [Variovorax sp. J22R187]MDM0028870.1 DsbA family protein [Variovorax sp. J31P216]
MKLIFVGDPMCSWCYGFGKELTALTARHPELPLEIMVGGLRAGATDVLDDNGKQFRLVHWARVEESSGLPFNRGALLARRNFVYDTEPICRAVVAARRIAPEANQLAVFRALQRAFYVDGLDTTDGAVLAQAASAELAEQQFTVDAATFHKTWLDSATIATTSAEFAQVQAMGIRSFPALLLEANGQLIEVSPGYAHVDQLERQLDAALRSLTTAA